MLFSVRHIIEMLNMVGYAVYTCKWSFFYNDLFSYVRFILLVIYKTAYKYWRIGIIIFILMMATAL